MSEREEKNRKLTKRIGIVLLAMVVAVSVIIIMEYADYQFKSRDVPISMTEPARTFQCQQTLDEYTKFKDFLGIEDYPTPEQINEMAWHDYKYLTELELKIEEFQCSLEPDT